MCLFTVVIVPLGLGVGESPGEGAGSSETGPADEFETCECDIPKFH